MNKTKKLKRVIMFFIVILIVIIVSLILIIFCTPIGKTYRTILYITSEKADDDAFPIGNTSEWYSEYSGTVSSRIIDKSVYYFANTLIPKYQAIEDIENYYEKNKYEIETLLGITDYETFYKLVEKIKTLQGTLVFEKYSFVDDSTVKKSSYVTTVVGIQYENNDVITFKLEISNHLEKGKTPVTYSINTNDKYEAERDDTVVDKSSDATTPGKVVN